MKLAIAGNTDLSISNYVFNSSLLWPSSYTVLDYLYRLKNYLIESLISYFSSNSIKFYIILYVCNQLSLVKYPNVAYSVDNLD